MSAIDNPTQHLQQLRKLATELEKAFEESNKKDRAKPGSMREKCARLVEMFQELDSALTEGGDAPEQWAEEG